MQKVYPRGIYVAFIATKDVESGHFSPSSTTLLSARPRYYTCDQVLNGVYPPTAIETSLANKLRDMVSSYDPNTSIIWLFLLTDDNDMCSESLVFETDVTV